MLTANDARLNVRSRGGLFVQSKSLADLLCYFGFRSSATFVLRCYGPEYDFIRVNYLDWGFDFAPKITVKIFFNDRLSRVLVCKESITGFEKCRRNKQILCNNK